MNIILAILLYLHVIVSPGVYQRTFINQMVDIHQPEITAVQNDPAQMQIVNDVYLPQVERIWIQDDTAME